MLFDFCSILNLKRHVSNIVFIRLIEISMIIEKLFLEKKMIGNLVDKSESCLKELKEKKKHRQKRSCGEKRQFFKKDEDLSRKEKMKYRFMRQCFKKEIFCEFKIPVNIEKSNLKPFRYDLSHLDDYSSD